MTRLFKTLLILALTVLPVLATVDDALSYSLEAAQPNIGSGRERM